MISVVSGCPLECAWESFVPRKVAICSNAHEYEITIFRFPLCRREFIRFLFIDTYINDIIDKALSSTVNFDCRQSIQREIEFIAFRKIIVEFIFYCLCIESCWATPDKYTHTPWKWQQNERKYKKNPTQRNNAKISAWTLFSYPNKEVVRVLIKYIQFDVRFDFQMWRTWNCYRCNNYVNSAGIWIVMFID